MRIRALAALLLVPLAAPAILPVAGASGTDVVVSEILPDPGSDREFIELWNRGNASADLTGWTIRDAANNTFTFGDRTLAAGDRVVVWSGGSGDALGPAWSLSAVWNNGGDTAEILDAGGAVVDTFTYGGSGPAAPPTGTALALIDGSWVEAEPTPGAAPGSEGGTATVTVEDVAPTVAIVADTQVRSGGTLNVTVSVDDANGDPVEWTLTGDGVTLATGTGTTTVSLTAPATAAEWALNATASDPGGNTATDTLVVSVRDADLAVEAVGDITFPRLAPGDTAVVANASFTVRNLADGPRTPRLDVSPFRSDTAEIPVDGNLHVGLRPAGTTGNLTWMAYTGPLTSLPELAAGEAVEAWLRIDAVPSPLAAGTYGTSFTVIA